MVRYGGYLYLHFFIYFSFLGRNPNAPYEVEQLFGAGNQVDGIKQWDSYEVESQKYLQIGERAIIQFPQTLVAEKRRHSRGHQWAKIREKSATY